MNDLKTNPPPSISAGPVDKNGVNLYDWVGTIIGPVILF